MSRELERLEAQLQTSFEGPAWHGPSVMEVLADVTPEQAAAHPLSGAHSIWELVLHLAATYRLVLRRLQKNDAPLTPDEDWPAVPAPTASNWRNAIGSLQQLNRQLRSSIVGFDAQNLDQPLASESYTAYAQFIGVTQHDLYHAGQIALLRKGLRETMRETG
jgi:uncharacterized damage-inducible protein DinB